MNDEKAVAIIGASGELSIAEVGQQVQKIQQLMRAVMKDGEHYGVIPGTQKPTLLKAGAEKLGFTFRLTPQFESVETVLPNGHREYRVKCTLIHAPSGMEAGEGVGLCSTMESKYRYRNVADYEILDDPIPEDAKQRKGEYRKAGFGMKKIDGVWCWIKYGDSERTENPDIADTYNTVLKMAKKRAHVDAMLTATAASDIFTQDMEDVVDRPEAKAPADFAEGYNRMTDEEKGLFLSAAHDLWQWAGAEAEALGSGYFTIMVFPLRAIERSGSEGRPAEDIILSYLAACQAKMTKKGKKKTEEAAARAELDAVADQAFQDDALDDDKTEPDDGADKELS